MKTAAIRQIERAHWRLCGAVERATQAAPADSELKELVQQTRRNWATWHHRLHGLECAAAARRDRGETLWTLFVPEHYCVRSITRTPHRLIRAHETQPFYTREPLKPSVDVRRPAHSLYDLAFQADRAREETAALRARLGAAAKEHFPAWSRALPPC